MIGWLPFEYQTHGSGFTTIAQKCMHNCTSNWIPVSDIQMEVCPDKLLPFEYGTSQVFGSLLYHLLVEIKQRKEK